MCVKLTYSRLYRQSSVFYKFLCTRCNSTKTYTIKSNMPNIEIPNLSVHDYIYQKWSNFPKKIAIECGITGKKYSFEDLRKKANNLSGALSKKLKLQKRDVVAIALPNCPDYAVGILGALQAGLTVTGISPLYITREITRHLQETNAKAIITSSLLLPILKQCCTGIPIIAIKENLSDSLPQGVICLNELTEEPQESIAVSIDVNDVAVMLSSSGSTGPPKAVELTHKNIVANICQTNASRVSRIIPTTADQQLSAIGILPFFHVGGFVTLLLASLERASKVITLSRFTPETYIQILETHKPHFLQMVPYIIGFLLNHEKIKKSHFESVQLIGSSAAPLSALDEERLAKKVGHHVHIFQAFGMTEVGGIVTLNDDMDNVVRGTVGEVLPNTFLKIVDDTGKSLGPNKHGELLVKGPQVMKGYHNKPKETQDAFLDGWLRSGDIGYYNENNLFYLTDRLKDLIKVKGFQVAPAEIEAIIREYPNVFETAVVGIPDSTYGEIPKAYVVTKNNCKINSEDIQKFVSQRVANYKQLKGGVEFIDALPKTPSGKIKREILRK